MKIVVISPYSRKLRGKETPNPKNYPYFEEVIKGLQSMGITVFQIGVQGEEKLKGIYKDNFYINYPLNQLEKLLKECGTFISIDNFFPHFANIVGKPGVVIFGQSDPLIYGHKIHTNLLKDRKYLRPDQFGLWESVDFNKECFIEPEVVIKAVLNKLGE